MPKIGLGLGFGLGLGVGPWSEGRYHENAMAKNEHYLDKIRGVKIQISGKSENIVHAQDTKWIGLTLVTKLGRPDKDCTLARHLTAKKWKRTPKTL